MGGVETMCYNWCWWLRNYFDVTLLYCSADEERLRKMSKLVKVEKYDENKTYECDIFIRNSVWGTIPYNVKAPRMIEMRHANYKYLLERGLLYQQYKDMGIKEIVGCGEFVSQMSHEALGDNPTTIKNILLPKKDTNKVIKLISCMRIDPAKGWNRMIKMMQMMRDANIKFEWNIFTNATNYKCNFEEVHFWKQRYDIWDYLADADYTVLLSDSEGLPYTVQESLEYQVPCIVTDVGGCTELIKDGVNGYVVPLDMNFDINKIKTIPKCPEYDNGALEAWLDYLEYDGKKIDKKMLIQKFKEEKEMKVKVKANKGFENVKDAERSTKEKTVYFIEGDIWEVDEERAEYLQSKGAVEIIEEVKKVEVDSKKIAEELLDDPYKDFEVEKKTKKESKKKKAKNK